jgi:hypothetical protein
MAVVVVVVRMFAVMEQRKEMERKNWKGRMGGRKWKDGNGRTKMEGWKWEDGNGGKGKE